MSLPFADLLDVLRAQGLAIGPDDHLRVARLLDRYDGASRDDLRGALAALLARDADEVAQVRAAFDLLYPAGDAPPRAEAPAPTPAPRRWRPWAVVAGLLVVAGVAAALVSRRADPPELATAGPAPRETPPEALRWSTDPCDPPARDDPTHALLLGLGGLIVLGVSSRRRGRGRRGAWSARRWREALDALPAPRWYDLDLDGVTAPPIARADLDDAATWLGRGRLTARHGELDVDGTLEATVAAGGAPAPRFRPRPAPAAVLVLHDTGAAMAPWRPHVDALIAGLRTRGVHVEVARFVDRPDVVQVDGAVAPLATLAQRAGHLPLLGVGPRAPTALPALRRFARRAWLNPVPDAAWWAPGFAAAEVDVWPLTRGGLLAAARHLVGHAAPPARGGPGAVRRRDVERLRWLRGLLPRPDDVQALALARTVAPDTRSAAIVALAVDPTRDDAAAAERWLRDHDDPLVRRPAHLRRVMIDAMDGARPDRMESAAGLRWRHDRALLDLRLGDAAARARGQAEVDALAATPLGRDVAEASGLAAPDATVLGGAGGRPAGFGLPSWGAFLAAAALAGLAWWSASTRTLLQRHVVMQSAFDPATGATWVRPEPSRWATVGAAGVRVHGPDTEGALPADGRVQVPARDGCYYLSWDNGASTLGGDRLMRSPRLLSGGTRPALAEPAAANADAGVERLATALERAVAGAVAADAGAPDAARPAAPLDRDRERPVDVEGPEAVEDPTPPGEGDAIEADDGQGPERDAGAPEIEEVDDGQGPDRATGGRPEPQRVQFVEPIRFAAGDDRLDAQAQRTLEQVALIIGAAPTGTSVRVTAVGDERLSLRRAAVVIDALRRAGAKAPMTARGVQKRAWPGDSDIDIVLTEGSPP